MENCLKYRLILLGPILLMGLLLGNSCQEKKKLKDPLPNIVLILADDLGYGDLASYNEKSLIPTPNLDRLASEGISLKDAYCPVSVCSPTRFAVMTGSYPFRSWKKSGVMANYEPSMISPGQLTLPQMLQKSGYMTGGFGKWHLGATYPTLDGKKPAGYGKFKADDNGANIDLTKPISDGPIDHGFVQWYGFSCPSECWIMDGNNIVAALHHDFYNIESAPNKDHIQIIPADQYLKLITDKSCRFLEEQATTKKSRPFFLYFAPYVPHIPLSVSREFQGITKAGSYGDYVHELDTYIGKILNKLDSLQISKNTIVLFASDNGSQFERTSKYMDLSNASNNPSEVRKKGQGSNVHYPNGSLRGTKWTAWEGGVRTPFIARWPGRFPAGTKLNQIFALNDLMATLASIIGFDLPEDEAVDSYDQLALLMGKNVSVRKSVVIQSSKNQLGLRKGKWKYIQPNNKNIEGELYNLQTDVSESENLYDKKPELAEQMKEELQEIIAGKSSKTN